MQPLTSPDYSSFPGTSVGTATCCAACPRDCQDRIDHLYEECNIKEDRCWETFKHDYKYMAQMMGCDGAAQAAPMVAALCVAVFAHLLS